MIALHPRRFFALGALALGLGCSSSSSAPPAPTQGTATLHFAVNSTVRTDPKVKTPMSGKVHGLIFHAEDVNVAGPRVDAKAVVSNVVLDVDLTKDGPSSATFKVPLLDESKYTFLGYLDVGNATAGDKPVSGDPVTLPGSDVQFDVAVGKDAEATITFNLVYGGA